MSSINKSKIEIQKPNETTSSPNNAKPLLATGLIRKPKCYNCKYASSQFKIGNLTHLQCNHPKHNEGFENGTVTAWDTLQIFSNTCNTHEFKN